MDPLDERHPQKTEPQGWGAVTGIVIIVALLIMGGMYFFMSGQAPAAVPSSVGAARA